MLKVKEEAICDLWPLTHLAASDDFLFEGENKKKKKKCLDVGSWSFTYLKYLINIL